MGPAWKGPLTATRFIAKTKRNLAFSTRSLPVQRRYAGQSVKVPRYNKSAYEGRGDRADASSFPSVEGPLEVRLFQEAVQAGREP